MSGSTDVRYRVTWHDIDSGGEVRVREFADVDQGYSSYEMMQREVNSYGATWDHIGR